MFRPCAHVVKVWRRFLERLQVQVDGYVTCRRPAEVHMSWQALLDTALETFTFQVTHSLSSAVYFVIYY